MKSAVLTALLLVVSVRCETSTNDPVSTDGPGSSCASTWMLLAQPADLSTGIGTSEVSVIVNYALGTRRPSQAVLEEVAAALSVRDAFGEQVPAQIIPVFGTFSDGAVEPDSIDEWLEFRDRILVVPESPWRNEWYSVTVGELPCKYRLSGFNTHVDGSSGVLRFNPQGPPVYRSLELCDYGEEKGTRLMVGLSQPVQNQDQISKKLKVVADGSACSFTPNPSDIEGSSRVFEFRCDASHISGLLFAVSEPLIALDGQPFATLAGSQVFSVEWPSDAWVDTGCWTWSPQWSSP
jgi:hypothetical protein